MQLRLRFITRWRWELCCILRTALRQAATEKIDDDYDCLDCQTARPDDWTTRNKKHDVLFFSTPNYSNYNSKKIKIIHMNAWMCIITVMHILVVVEIKVIKIRTKQQYYIYLYIYILSYYILLHFFSKKKEWIHHHYG